MECPRECGGQSGRHYRFEATFEQYWQEAEFEAYKPQRDAQRLDRALSRQGRAGSDEPLISVLFKSGLETVNDVRIVHRTHADISFQSFYLRGVGEIGRAYVSRVEAGCAVK